MAGRRCPRPNCPRILTNGERYCAEHAREASQKRRPGGSVYGTPGHRRFRAIVLQRNPVCVLCRTAPATVADHYPVERRELVAQGLDPNDPARGRGLCKPCHDRKTARTSPGGWNNR